MSPPKKLKTSFSQLEDIVNKVESGQLSLEETIPLLKKGLSLSREIKHKLDSVEDEIEGLQTAFEQLNEK